MEQLATAQLYINGEITASSNGDEYDNISPWTGAAIGTAADATRSDVEHAIASARTAFDQTDWRNQHELRAELVTRLLAAIEARKDELTTIAQLEAGAALGAAARAHIDGAINGGHDLLRCFKEIQYSEDRGRKEEMGFVSERIVEHEPLGVVAAITPWNVPLYINVGKVFSALLAGCTVILKPAPETPLMGAILGKIASELDFPPGVFNVITSKDPAMAGEMLVTDPRVDVVSFTGSTAVGKRIMEAGAPTLKRIFLELGGKSANILLDDTPEFAQAVMSGIAVFHAGQGCAMATRMLVPKSRYQEAVGYLSMAYQGFADKWGDFGDASQIMGPVISERQYQRIQEYIEIGQKEGARLLAGGKARPDKGTGYFIEPTCFVDVTNDMRIAQEEIFGPVLSVIAYEDDEDAIRIANESNYALAGAVTSASRERALNVARKIRAGAVSINGGMCVTGDLPFGGFKSSGVGREWGLEGIMEFMDSKAIAIRCA